MGHEGFDLCKRRSIIGWLLHEACSKLSQQLERSSVTTSDRFSFLEEKQRDRHRRVPGAEWVSVSPRVVQVTPILGRPASQRGTWVGSRAQHAEVGSTAQHPIDRALGSA